MRIFARLLPLAALIFAIAWPVTAQQRTPFVREGLQAEVLRFEARIRRENEPAGRNLAQLQREAEQAQSRGDIRGATNALAAAIQVEPNNLALILRLSDLYRQVDARNDWQLRTEMQSRSVAAAYLAYQRARSPTDEARALWFLAEAYAARSMWRPALDALRISLELNEVPAARQRYDALLADHGFRILDYRVDSDTASPRVCFQFSEPLRARLDAAPYVRMPAGIPGAVVADGEQLCVDGLRHGERYEIQLRRGLPSAVVEALPRDADYQIYVRDRSPSVRFTGRNYVLPRVGQQGIPVVSVNLSEVALRVARIGDRSIAPTVLDENFLAALGGEEARRILEQRGTEVWSGRLATENRLNEEVITAFPVSEALGERLQPGVYVMFARRPDVPETDEPWQQQATQWFVVSDLGVSSTRAGDGLHAEVRSLATAEPVADAELRLIARNNEVLATVRTGPDGRARFEAGLVRGEGGQAPGVLVASREGDYVVLNLAAAAFDLTDRGVSGRPAPGPLDAFVVTERGVYRSGETVHVTALLRDANGAAIAGMPITLVLERPDGVEARRAQIEDMGAGGRAWSVQLLSGSMTGTWRIKALVDPRRPPIGQVSFLVEDYVPERLELTLEPQGDTVAPGRPASIAVTGRWLFGAPAADLTLEGETIISPASEPPAGLEGYRVGLADEQLPPQRRPLQNLPRTDRDGRARVEIALPDLPATSRPLQIETLLRLTEASGRGVERRAIFRVADRRAYIGIRPLFSGSIGDGEAAIFDVAMVGPDGRPAAQRGLRWELSRIETRYQYYRTDGRWNFQSVTSARRVADGRVDVAPGTPGRIAARVEWGRYRLDVTNNEGVASSVTFSAGWAGAELRADSPDVLDVALDRASYGAGDTAQLRVNARFAGRATIQVVAERVLHTQDVDLTQGPNSIAIPVGSDWGAGGYVVATAFRALDAGARRQPGRAIGVRWLSMDSTARTIPVTLDVPEQIRPRSTLRVPVRLAGLQAGETARVTVAAVDVGILNLTGYRAPDPAAFYYGQRALGAEFRDLYGFLIDGMQGVRGRIRSGGDGAAELQGTPPTQAPLALFSGVVEVGPDGVANVEFDIPAFAGTVRVMAVAWSAGKVGSASRDVVVRDPIVVSGTLPRFLAAGDRSRFLVEVHNVDGPPGEYTVSLDATGPVLIPAEAVRRTLRLERNQRQVFSIPVTAAGMGRAGFELAVAGPEGVASGQSFTLALHPANPIITRRTVRTIAANGTLEIGPDLLADVLPGTGSVALSIGPSAALDVPGLLQQLARYPLACTEQTVSRAMALMRLSRAVDEASLGLDRPLADFIRESIERVQLRQSSNGSFGLWGVGGGDLWLDAFVADFLTRAREAGHPVARAGFESVLDRLRNAVSNREGQSEDAAEGTAYALYVLARNGRPVIGDLRYLADARAEDIGSPMAQAQVGAALALLGDRGRAQPLFTRAVQTISEDQDEEARRDFGSRLRDGAAILALMNEADADRRLIQRTLTVVDRLRGARRYTSTQENLWLALAAEAARQAGERIALDIGNTPHQGVLARTFRPAQLTEPLTIRNRTDAPVQAVVGIVGAPAAPEPPGGNALRLERTYQRFDGTRVDPRRVRQNERLIVILRVTEAEPRFGRLALIDRLPAGFEIDSPALVSSARVRGIEGLAAPAASGETAEPGEAGEPAAPGAPVHTEFRDDRFVAVFERRDGAQPVFAVAYIVRAVAPGTYSHPGAFIEDMYAPERFARTATGSVEVTAAQ